jgi:hexosaminidase
VISLLNKRSNLFFLSVFVLAIGCKGPQVSEREPVPVLPMPSQILALEGAFEINPQTIILYNDPALPEANYLADWLERGTGFRPSVERHKKGRPKENSILLNIISGDTLSEAYSMQIIGRHIWMTAESRHGIFYAIQTLRQLLAPDMERGTGDLGSVKVEGILIEDHPKFRHRGLLLDCCRHFMNKEYVMRMIDLLAYHKMNVLHWHLTEDQGWRIEIDAFPKLTEVGAWRTQPDGSRYGGFYTKDDIREIVAHAASRHVTVIPEIELPGHALAALASYPELSCRGLPLEVTGEWGVFKDIYCAGNDSVFVFLEKVLDEVLELFPSPYIHIGGDEAPKSRWADCDKCQARIAAEQLADEHELQSWFISRIGNYLASKGRKMIGWDEILEGGLPAGAAVQSWRGMDGGLTAAEAGHEVIMSPTSHCYFDYDLESIDLEKVYSFDPIPERMDAQSMRYVIGGECNMWTERAPQHTVDSKVFPRILAMSEVLWRHPGKRDFEDFRKRVLHHYARLDALGVDYGAEGTPAALTSEISPEGGLTLRAVPGRPGLKLEVRFGGMGEWRSMAADSAVEIEQGEDLLIEVRATRPDGRPYGSPQSIRMRNHPALGAPVKLAESPKAQYMAGGTNALTDGVLGSPDRFHDGRWQGTFGKDVVAEVTLPAPVDIRLFSARFFQYQNSWIFLPKAVEFHYSSNGTDWISAGTVRPKARPSDVGLFAEEFRVTLSAPVRAKAVRLTALNFGPCPTWHDAAGEPSWLFCDEFVVE